MAEVNETTLLAYVDGKLSPAEAKAIDEVLEGDPQAQAIVRKLRATPSNLREVFDATLARSLPPICTERILRHDLTPRARGVRWAHAIAASAALFFVGVFVGYVAPMRTTLDAEARAHDAWVKAVVDYQVLYGRPTLHVPNPGWAQVREAEQKFAKVMGYELQVPNWKRYGLEFKRGQVLEMDGQPLIQLAYLPTRGKPIAYCVFKGPATELPAAGGDRSGLRFVHWRQNGYAHIIVGDHDEELLLNLARTVNPTATPAS